MNTTERHRELQSIAAQIFDEHGIDVEATVPIRALAVALAERTGCTRETAERNIGKYVRRQRGLLTKQHGGARPGAGRKPNPMRAVKLPVWLIEQLDEIRHANEPRWKVIARLLKSVK